MDLESPTPEFWQGAAIGVAAFALVVAAYPEIPLLSLTTGSLLAVVAVYLGTVALEASDDEDSGLESTEAERILVSRLSEIDPFTLDSLSEDNDRVRQAIGDLIELWAEGDDSSRDLESYPGSLVTVKEAGDLPILTSERLLVEALDQVAPESLDQIADGDARLSRIVEELIYKQDLEEQ
jgi:hypothetical protein